MNLAMGRVNHQPFKIRLVNESLEYFVPSPIVAPAFEPFVDAAEFAVVIRQIAPRGTCAENPANAIEKPAVIFRYAAPLSSLSWEMRLYFSPDGIRHIASVLFFAHKHHP
jgi:hypothetical protein